MSIPGSNLLNQAARIIAKKSMTYYAYSSRTKGDNGLYVNNYAAGITVTGSIQPVTRIMYEKLGLDMTKNYYVIFLPRAVNSVGRGAGSDKIVFSGMTLMVESQTPWSVIDGWTELLVVQV